ncbi:hypothetical protein [Haloarcula litorea]|uniref:DUF7856 family protein n=1 Tax=Haloarcula litorea TaxID=3032579 RepID=UPI0023E84312|nr:hypothetical protein [Halomicroarcula sp. GDY20]
MRVVVDGRVRTGRAVAVGDLPVGGAELAAAVRGERDRPTVEAPSPTPVYDYCGRVRPEMGLETRTALATAARSLGATTPRDETIAALRSELDDLSPAQPSRPPALDPPSADRLAALRETAATERGRLDARTALDAETDGIEQTVRSATRELTEAETERTAAVEQRVRRREAAREYRDRLDERRRLADRLANERRAARAHLVDSFTDRFRDALAAVPASVPPEPFEAPPVAAALAVLRLGHTPAPVVLEVDRFDSPAAAADALDAPVLRC